MDLAILLLTDTVFRSAFIVTVAILSSGRI